MMRAPCAVVCALRYFSMKNVFRQRDAARRSLVPPAVTLVMASHFKHQYSENLELCNSQATGTFTNSSPSASSVSSSSLPSALPPPPPPPPPSPPQLFAGFYRPSPWSSVSASQPLVFDLQHSNLHLSAASVRDIRVLSLQIEKIWPRARRVILRSGGFLAFLCACLTFSRDASGAAKRRLYSSCVHRCTGPPFVLHLN
jgi:hypothetical protein